MKENLKKLQKILLDHIKTKQQSQRTELKEEFICAAIVYTL